MAFAASITNISTVPANGYVAVGESITLNFRLNNTGTGNIYLESLFLYYDDTLEELNPLIRPLYRIYIDPVMADIGAGKNRTFSIPLSMINPGGFHLPNTRTSACVLYAGIGHSSGASATLHTSGITPLAIDMRYGPSIPRFTVYRHPTEESTGAAVGIKCALAAGANPSYPGLALTLQWKEVGAATFPPANTMAVGVAGALSASGVTVNPNYVFEAGKAYALRVTFTDGIDSAFSETILAKSFAVFDVSPDGHGFAVGQYATGTEQNPKFECAYPAHFYGGLPQMDYSASRVNTGLKWANGKVIYRKVFTFSIASGSTQATVSTGESAINAVVELRGVLIHSGGAFPIPRAHTSALGWQASVYINNIATNPALIIDKGPSFGAVSGHIILEYTLP